MHLHSADTAPPSPRSPEATITSDFATTWPAVETPLRRYLGSIGVNRHDIDDLVQETASRVISSNVSYNDAGQLRAWSFVVARRLLADLHRASRRQVELDDSRCPDLTQDDLMRQVEDRAVIETVLASAAQLSAVERRHLTGRPVGSAAELNRARVARHRARQRLRRLVGPLVVVAAMMRRRLAFTSASVGAAALALPLALLPGHGHPPDSRVVPITDQPGAARTAAETETVERPGARTVPRAPLMIPGAAHGHRGNGPLARAPVVRAFGPAGSNAHAAVGPNDGRQPPVCLNGTIVSRCVDLPTGIGLG